ncbi:MAG: hypothetical protein AAGA80_18525, partial [Cyanobacteria bacterium P01_F01_bin.143]
MNNIRTNQARWEPSEGLPDIPPPLESLSSPGYSSFAQIKSNQLLTWKNEFLYFLSNKGVQFLLNAWQKNRQEYIKYNSWVILPKQYRDRLWRYTKEWIELIFNSLDEISSPNNLLLLYELNWRLEKTLTPLIFEEWVEQITEVIEKFNPYPSLIDLKEASITPDQEKYQKNDWDWEKIQKAWIELAFILLRAARDNHDKKSFYLWLNRLENIVNQNSEWQSRWYYERCLFHLYRLEHYLVVSIVTAWGSKTISDWWQIKRASVIAQLGNLQDAQRIAKQTLNNIRSCIQPDSLDYSLLSQEGWAMRFLIEIEDQIELNKIKDKDKDKNNSRQTYLYRWEKLAQYYCNPNTEIKFLEQAVDRPTPKPQKQTEEKRGFLSSDINRTFYFGSKNLYPEFRPAFESLRILEEGALPLNLNNVKWHSKHIKNVSKWSIPFFPTWSFLSLIQVSTEKEVKEWLSFIDIAILPQEIINC